MTPKELIALLRVAESALWDAAGKAPDVVDAHGQIARALARIDAEDSCPHCGNPLAQRGAGRPKRYCTDNCRKAAYVGRKNS